MYSFLHNLLSDKKGGEIFTLFGGWHFFYVVLTLFAVAGLCYLLKNKGNCAKQKATKSVISMAFGLYIADFFLMPLAYGEIDIEKLPFHACTAMCVACFLSHYNGFLEKYRTSFVLLGFISNLVYLIYPAGVMWHAVHPLSYRVIQTLLFHSLMTIYGFLVLIYEHGQFDLKKSYRDLAVIVCMTLWAMLGNAIYNGTSEGYSHFFNWFFVVRDPFYAIPVTVAPFIMPFLNVAVFFAAEIAVHLILREIRRKKAQKACCHFKEQK
ncbi:MAG: YwaF family protein [Clostridia bacterium]|nr:YwaF family protein [Elusimicrobiaceae bacterium]MBQ9802091.1 YwaF family protein [Clostridia bacterium]